MVVGVAERRGARSRIGVCGRGEGVGIFIFFAEGVRLMGGVEAAAAAEGVAAWESCLCHFGVVGCM